MNGRCPVELAVQVWIEASMTWFVGQFGKQAALGFVPVPREGFLPLSYEATPRQIQDLVSQVCHLVSVDPATVEVRLFGGGKEGRAKGRRAVGHYRKVDGRAVIGLDVREAADPAYLTAVIAHELGHVRLLGEGRIAAGRGDGERLTDLFTVFFGFGVFTTNAALRFDELSRGWSVTPRGWMDERQLNAAGNGGYSRTGYLSEREFGYALACHAWLRGETDPPWAAHLDPGPSVHLRQGLTYLARHADQGVFPTQRRLTPYLTLRLVPAARGSLLPTGLPHWEVRMPTDLAGRSMATIEDDGGSEKGSHG